MTIAIMRERLHDLITEADDKKIEAIYDLFGELERETYDWSKDEAFVAELDERVRRYEAGIDKAYTRDEMMARFGQWKQERAERKNDL